MAEESSSSSSSSSADTAATTDKQFRLDNVVPTGIPLPEFELAFGWRGFECPIVVDKEGNYHCDGCSKLFFSERDENNKLKEPPMDVRFSHEESCETYRLWRRVRWLNFNNSMVGRCVGVFFKQNLIPYYNIKCELPLAENLDALFNARVVQKETSSASSSSSSSKAEVTESSSVSKKQEKKARRRAKK